MGGGSILGMPHSYDTLLDALLGRNIRAFENIFIRVLYRNLGDFGGVNMWNQMKIRTKFGGKIMGFC